CRTPSLTSSRPIQSFRQREPCKTVGLRHELEQRRETILRAMSELQTRLDYISALLAVPELAVLGYA
ncbi:MAG TPA: hypothetical protein VH372_02910, partial [Actinospica sp.]|nr:hypothetical protein [Actinospica sp.]